MTSSGRWRRCERAAPHRGAVRGSLGRARDQLHLRSLVMDAIDPARFDVVPVGITKQGTWHLMQGAAGPAVGDWPDVRGDGGSRRGNRGVSGGRRRRPRARRRRRQPCPDRCGVARPARPDGRGRRGAGHVRARRRAIRGGRRARVGDRHATRRSRRCCSSPPGSPSALGTRFASPSGWRIRRGSRPGSRRSATRSSSSRRRSAHRWASRRRTIPGSSMPRWPRPSGSPGRLSWSTGSRLRERSNARCSATTTRSHPSAARSFPPVTSSTTTPRSTSTPGARASTFLPTSIPRCRRASNAWR